MKKELKKIIAALLVISIVFNAGMFVTQAKTTHESVRTAKKETITELRELVDERTENSNTYLLSDGSKRIDICSQRIRYQEKGKLKEYDSSLVAMKKADREKLKTINCGEKIDAYKVVNKSGDSKQYFPQQLDKETPVVMNKGKYSLSFAPIVDKKYNSIIDGNKIKYKANEIISEYEYISQKNGIKENIVLSSKPSKNEICFKVDSKNITLIEDKQNEYIYFVDTESRQKVGYILPPNMKDRGGNINYEDISYKVIDNENETFLKLIINKKYLERALYPVVVDPTAVWFMNQYLPTAMVSSMEFVRDQTLHPSEFVIKNKCDPTFPYKGTEQRLYLDTSHVISGDSYIGDKVEWNKKIIKRAQLSVAESTSNYTAGTVEVKKVKNSWSAENITWNTQPELGDTIASFKCNGVDRNRHTLDITEAVTEMISNGELNNGLAFVAKESGTGEVLNGPELGPSYMWFSVEYYDKKEILNKYSSETNTITQEDYYYNNIVNTVENGYIPNNLSMYEEGISTYGLLPGGSLSSVSSLTYPYSAVVTFKTVGSLEGYGSGFVIGPNVVLTAGHCIVNENGIVNNMRAVSQFGTQYSREYTIKEIYYSAKYINNNIVNKNYDWAIVIVNGDIGSEIGWYGYEVTNSLLSTNITVAGYTKYDGSGWSLFKDNGTVMSITDYRIRYNANTIGGESGGPVFDINNIVQAVHTHGYATGDPNPLNSGTRINSLIFNLATEKKNEGKLLYNY